MAINPLISLQAKAPDIGKTFSNVLLSLGRIEDIKRGRAEAPARQRLLEAQAGAAEAAVPTEQQRFNAEQLNMISSLATGGRRIIPDLKAGNIERVTNTLQQRMQALQASGLPTQQTEEAIALAQSNPEELLRVSQQAVDLEKQMQPAKAAFQFGGQEIFKEDVTGALYFGTTARSPVSGQVQTVFSAIDGGPSQPANKVSLVSATGETREEKLETEREQSKIAIQKARGIEKSKLTEKRISDITVEMSERNRNAARSSRSISEAFKLSEKARQGLTGAVKLQLGRVFSGIDVADEAALSSAFNSLALDQLQKFKGPTTDFEFRVSQSIPGSLSRGKSANQATLNSLKRAEWFTQRESKQFQKFVKDGGNPDNFKFDFQESVMNIKGQRITLQDIQDTAVKNHLTIEEVIKRLRKMR